jgi:hypothetical protein
MKNLQKGFIVPLLAVIAVLVIGGGVYYFSTNNQPDLVNTDGWETYQNEKYGFEFQYPSDWHARVWGVVQVSAPVSSFSSNTDGPTTSIIVNDDRPRTIEGESIIISGRNAIDSGWKTGVQNGFFRTIAINDSSLSIQMTATSLNDQTIEEKIISTFKFKDINDNSGTVTSSTNNSFLITYPKGGENLEIGKTYKLAWQNNSGKIPRAIAIQTISQNGEDYGYGNIITSNIPSANNGSIDWTVASTFNLKHSYKLVIFGDNREILGSSDRSFSIVDKRPLSVTIAGGDTIVINKNNLFTFNKPFTVSGTPSQNGSMTIYSSSADLQKIFMQVSISKFSADACEVLHAYDAPICDVKGEQAVTLDITAVLSDNTSSWITKRKVSLSSRTVKTRQLERVGSNYKIELVSMDLQNKTASIIVSPI